MDSGLTLVLEIGSDRNFPVQINGADGKPATGLLGTDTLVAQVWAGQDQAVLFAPAVAWRVAASGTITVTFVPANTSALGVGNYRLRVTLTRGSKTTVAVEAWLQLTLAPGLATPPATYGTAAGVREHLPWGDRYESPSGLAGFVLELSRSRKWVDSIILAQAPPPTYTTIGGYSGYTRMQAGFMGGRSLARNQTLKGYLDANKLVQTSDLLEAVHRYAAHLVIKGTIGGKADDPLKKRSQELLVEAESWLGRVVAEVDIDGDGYADWVIPLGVTTTRRA